MNLSLSKLQEMVRRGKPGVLQSMGLQRVGHDTVNNNKDDIILNKCITKVTVQIARTLVKMLYLISNQEHAYFKPQWNAATPSPE